MIISRIISVVIFREDEKSPATRRDIEITRQC